MAADPPYAVGAVLVGPAVAELAKPKPEGSVMLCQRGACGSPTPVVGQRDTVTPTFSVPFPHVALDDTVLVRLSLVDKRVLGLANEPIGTVDLNARDLVTALNVGAGHVYDVRVVDQGTHQILFVGVSVVREQ
jgi:hypothetical protein